MRKDPLVSLVVFRRVRLLTAASLAAILVACASGKPLPAPGQVDADKFLFDRGNEYLQKKNWTNAREYFRRIVDGYPQSQYRTDAKLGIGDSFLGEGHPDSLILGANEFREFLTFFPLNPRADYAQYHLALCLSKQMLAPQRDQSATRDALTELQKFLDRYPNSPHRSEVDKLYRETRDRLSESEYRVGLFYYRSKWSPGAIERFKALLTADPDYSRRDAVYYYLGESLLRVRLDAQALPYFERLLAEHPKSEFRVKAEKRVAELKIKG